MKIGWARDDEGERIRALLLQDGLNLEGGDWTGLAQTWLVARDKAGTVQACIAVHPGRPVGRLDFLAIEWSLKGLSRVKAYKAIMESAVAVLAARGASFVAGVVPYYLPDYGEFVGTYGCKQLNEGWLFIGAVNEVLDKINHGRRIKKHHNDHSHADA